MRLAKSSVGAVLGIGVAFAASFPAIGPAQASTIIYSNFSDDPSAANNPYNADTIYGYSIRWVQTHTWGDGNQAPVGNGYAMPFTVSLGHDIPLESISLPMYKFPATYPYNSWGDTLETNHDNLTIELVKDAGGLPSTNSADLVETFAVNPLIPEDTASFLHLDSSSQPLLEDGETYWVIARPTDYTTVGDDFDSLFYWIQNVEGATFYNTANQFNPFSYTWQGFFSQSFTAAAPGLNVFGVSDAQTVSEPGVLALLSLGLFGIGAIRRTEHRTASDTRCIGGLH